MTAKRLDELLRLEDGRSRHERAVFERSVTRPSPCNARDFHETEHAAPA
jgi:hypothetical protein